jgi:PAS domain S-box-containing protein
MVQKMIHTGRTHCFCDDMRSEFANSQDEQWATSATETEGSPLVATTPASDLRRPEQTVPGADEEVARGSPKRRLSVAEALDLLEVEKARRQLAENGLRESEERFRQMSQHLGKFLWLSDAETKELIYVSPGYEEVWHRCREARYCLPSDWLNDTPPNSKTRIRKNPIRQVNTGKDKAEYQVAALDGSMRWIRDRMFPIRDSAGQTLYMLGVAEDITDIKSLEEALRKNELKDRALLGLVPDTVFRLRRDGTILEFRPGKESPMPSPSVDLAGKNLKDLLPEQVASQAMHYLELTLSTGQMQTFTCQHLLPDYPRDFEARSIACGDDEVMALVRDVTERKRLEKEVVEISSREQQRLGQDLHDGLGQHLTGITFLSKALERKLALKSMTEANEAAEIGRLVMQALSQTRNLARGLFPIELEGNGLVTALRELVSNVERIYRIKCQFQCAPELRIADNLRATHVFRIAQEAVSNSIRHGKAQNIAISLVGELEKIRLCVQDDGSGFALPPRNEGLGLKIMQYRARRIGGTFDIQRGPTGGTVLTVVFPLTETSQ